MQISEAEKFENIVCYLGTIVLSDLEKLKLSGQTSYLIINLLEVSIGIAIYNTLVRTDVYICDATGVLLAGLPPKLTEFLCRHFTNINVYTTNKLSHFSSTFSNSFILYMSKNHSYQKFLANFTNDFEFNDYIINFL